MTFPAPSESDRPRDFLAVATQLAMLSPDAARDVARQAATRGLTPTEVVLQRGILNVVELDIVETILHPGDTVPGYVIEGVIGHGGMGVVYRARQTTLNRVVALKTVLVSRMTDPGAVARFEHEAMTVGRLRHPNIVAAHDFGRHEGRLFFAMELVEGENLEQRIDRLGPLDERTALGILRQAAFGLAYATQQGIIHRDIKPANLLLLDPPEGSHLPDGVPMVKLADFGLAFLVAESDARTRMTSLDTPIGSPNYIAPEQLEGERIDARADIYALGATLYHMLASVPPFSGKTLAQIIAQKLVGDVEPLRDRRPELSDEIIELTAWMMTRDPGDRISDYPTLLAHIDSLTGELWSGSEFTLPAATLEVTSATLNADPESIPTVPLKASLETSREVGSRTPFGRRKGDRPARSRRVRLGWLIAGMTALLVLVGWAALKSMSPRMHRDLIPNGATETLFDGQTLSGWIATSGAWGVATDEDGASVLAGTDGAIDRPLFLRRGPTFVPIRFFVLELFVQMHDAAAVEVQFGIKAKGETDGNRLALRITHDAVWLVQRQEDLGPFVRLSDPIPIPDRGDRKHVVRIERHTLSWWIYFDDLLVGSIADATVSLLHGIELAAEGGPAWFSDVRLEELAPASDVRP